MFVPASGRLWRDYQEQKKDISQLLSKAEAELKQSYTNVDPHKISNELRTRHEEAVELRKTSEEMLCRLRTILEELSSNVSHEQLNILEQEIKALELRTEMIKSLNMEKIAILEDFSSRLKTVLGQVESIVSWLQTAQKLVQQLLSLNLSPDERARRTEELQTAIHEKLTILTTVEEEIVNLSTMHGNVEPSSPVSPTTAQLLFGVDVIGLRGTISQMNQTIQEHSHSVFQDMEHWKEYNVQAEEVKPWLDEAEKRTATMVARPTSLSEMESLLDAARLFEDECKRQLAKLQQMSSHCQSMIHQSSTKDEVDALHTRWNGVHDSVVQQLERLEHLQSCWNAVLDKMDAIVDWLDAVEGQLQHLQRLASSVDSLEHQLGDLKGVMKGASERQSDLIVITQECDAIVPNLSPEGAASLRSQVMELKGRVSHLSDAARQQINTVSDAILQRYNCSPLVESCTTLI